MCWVMPPASRSTTLDSRMRSSRLVLPWSTWPMTTTTGARSTRSSSLSTAVSMSFSSMVTITSFSTLQPSSSAMMAAVSKSIISLREAMTPFFIRHFTTSAPVFFIREASSPTPISSGILTTRGCFFAISAWRRRIFSCSSWRRLLPWKPPPRRLLLRPWNFCLPACIWLVLPAARVSSFSSYLARFTSPPLRVSTTFFSGTRVAGRLTFCCAALWGWPPCWGAALGAWGCWPWGAGAPLWAGAPCRDAVGAAGAVLGASGALGSW